MSAANASGAAVPLGSARLADREFVEAFENGTLPAEMFHHADHIRLAWLYLRNHTYEAAERRFCDGLVRFATRFGVPEKFHLTMTLAWLRAVHARIRTDGEISFDAWLASHSALLDRNFLLHHYSKERLESQEARTGWLEPDRKALGNQRVRAVDRAPLEYVNQPSKPKKYY
jgi:hypothetical protein